VAGDARVVLGALGASWGLLGALVVLLSRVTLGAWLAAGAIGLGAVGAGVLAAECPAVLALLLGGVLAWVAYPRLRSWWRSAEWGAGAPADCPALVVLWVEGGGVYSTVSVDAADRLALATAPVALVACEGAAECEGGPSIVVPAGCAAAPAVVEWERVAPPGVAVYAYGFVGEAADWRGADDCEWVIDVWGSADQAGAEYLGRRAVCGWSVAVFRVGPAVWACLSSQCVRPGAAGGIVVPPGRLGAPARLAPPAWSSGYAFVLDGPAAGWRAAADDCWPVEVVGMDAPAEYLGRRLIDGHEVAVFRDAGGVWAVVTVHCRPVDGR
jgi:hypothetical protein